MRLPNVSGLFYKIGFAAALLSAGLVAKHDYDGRIAAAAVLKERVKVDSVFIKALNHNIAGLNERLIAADFEADSLRALASKAKVATQKVRADYDSLRADLDTTDIADLNAALDSADAVIDAQDEQIADLESAVDAMVKARALAAEREATKDEKIAALDRLNQNISKAVTPPTHHLRDGAIGGAIVAVGGVILWATTK
jgi:chromosome segregation ATPase